MNRLAAGAVGALATVAAAGGYVGLVTGALPVDVGIGRRTRPLGPLQITVEAARQVVYDVLSAPYAERSPRAMQEKVVVLERGKDLVLAAHRTLLRGRLMATTVETVKFEPPDRIYFRLVRGPVPHVLETFTLEEVAGACRVTYSGELGTDLWTVGQRWGDVVAKTWEAAVQASLTAAKAEAERRGGS